MPVRMHARECMTYKTFLLKKKRILLDKKWRGYTNRRIRKLQRQTKIKIEGLFNPSDYLHIHTITQV
jgi:hypothetical protein